MLEFCPGLNNQNLQTILHLYLNLSIRQKNGTKDSDRVLFKNTSFCLIIHKTSELCYDELCYYERITDQVTKALASIYLSPKFTFQILFSIK